MSTSLSPEVLVLGHVLSQDNPWIPMLTVAGIGVVVVFALAATGRLVVEEPGDLLLPLASVVLLAGLTSSLATADWLLDQGPWIVPAALVVLVGLVVAAVSDRVAVGPTSVAATGTVAGLALVAAVASFGPLDRAWFGEDTVFAVEPGDATVALTLVEPPGEDGRFTVEVVVEGGTLGDNVPTAVRPPDPEQGMAVKFLVDGQPRFPAVPPGCAEDPGCTSARFELAHAGDEPLRQVTVELLTADQVPFVSPLSDSLGGDELGAP